MKRLCVCVATSEKTWPRNDLMTLNSAFFAAREQFDLAIIHNGEITPQAEAYFSRLPIDQLLPRENVGHEGGAFTEAIRRLPAYEWYLFLHDDHWFWRPDWGQQILPLLEHRERTCFGNLVTMKFHWDEECNVLAQAWNFALAPAEYIFPMLQGMAGFHPRSAIEVFLNHGGVPHLDYRKQEFQGLTHFTELSFSLFLIQAGFHFEPLPGGFEYLLMHGSNALCEHSRESFARLPEDVQRYLPELHRKLHG
ncbi:MAG: hypothetical protein FJ398_13895 [Verrucomicrobia bacterium]|nr:hypothetical protein [Verrucomicrobiota bacterium]